MKEIGITMDFSILICTHNRAEDLGRALTSLVDVKLPDGVTWEVIVIDNASTDATPSLRAVWEGSSLPLRWVHEAQLGQVFARNRALDEARGDALLFLDDDVTVSPNILVDYAKALHANPDCGFFGGPIRPVLPDPPSPLAELVLAQYPSVYSGLDLGEKSRPLQVLDGPYGANMLVRRNAIRGARFTPELGYVGQGGVTGDETWFLLQIADSGATGRWIPDAWVRHWIPARRATWAGLKRSAQASARAAARMERMRAVDPRPATTRLLLWYARRVLRFTGRAVIASVTRDLQGEVSSRFAAWQASAELSEALGAWRIKEVREYTRGKSAPGVRQK